MKTKKKNLLQFICATAMVGLLAGCSSSSSSDSDDDAPQASVRVIHAVADAPNVNVGLNGGDQIQDLAFADTTALLEVDAAEYSVSVDALLPGGDTIEGVIDVKALDLVEGKEITVLAVGNAAEYAGGDTDAIRPLVVVPPDEAIQEGQIRVSVVHAAFGVPEVDIYVTEHGNESLTGTDPITLDFEQQVSAQIPADPGRRIRITAAGDDDVLYDSGDQIPALPAGQDVVIAAINNTGAEEAPVRLLAVFGDQASDSAIFRDKDAKPALRAAHFSEDAGEVDIEVGGTEVLTGIEFTQVSEFLAVPSELRNEDGTATVDVGPGAVDADVPLVSGDYHTGYAVGLAGNGLELIASSDAIRSVATEARVRVVHAASQVPGDNGEVDVYVGESGSDLDLVLEGVAFKDISDYLSLPVDLLAGSTDYDFQVFAAGADPEGDPAIEVSDVTLDAGGVYTVIARDDDTSVPSFAAELVDDAEAAEDFRE